MVSGVGRVDDMEQIPKHGIFVSVLLLISHGEENLIDYEGRTPSRDLGKISKKDNNYGDSDVESPNRAQKRKGKEGHPIHLRHRSLVHHIPRRLPLRRIGEVGEDHSGSWAGSDVELPLGPLDDVAAHFEGHPHGLLNTDGLQKALEMEGEGGNCQLVND